MAVSKPTMKMTRVKGIQTPRGSLTVEAALVMPIFLYFIMAFLYFIQIFMVQEQIQTAITKMGLSWSKAAYFYKDFPDIEEAVGFDKSILSQDIISGIDGLTDLVISTGSLKIYAKQYLDKDFINHSCIIHGFDGIDFSYSSVTNSEGFIDIILKYKVAIPVKMFILGNMTMLQRVRLRSWTGYEVAPIYTSHTETKEEMVYVTDTGTVYHKSRDCSHIKLSVTEVQGIPEGIRNKSGEKYTKCEECCKGQLDVNAIYYITAYGSKYHTDRNCSGIKRSVKEIPISEAGNRRPCSRCCNEREK